MGKIYSQYDGIVKISKQSSHMDLIEVVRTQADNQQEVDEKLGVKEAEGPQTGQVVYGRVSKIEDRFCKVDIIAVDEIPVNQVFVGIILQEGVRAFDKSNIEMHNSFRPGDIVKARVTAGVGGGTSRDSSVLLTTAEEELGVVFARSPHTGALMVPRSWTEFECVQTKTKHKRKVGKPQ